MIRFEGGPLDGQEMPNHTVAGMPERLYVRATGNARYEWSYRYLAPSSTGEREYEALSEPFDPTKLWVYERGGGEVFRLVIDSEVTATPSVDAEQTLWPDIPICDYCGAVAREKCPACGFEERAFQDKDLARAGFYNTLCKTCAGSIGKQRRNVEFLNRIIRRAVPKLGPEVRP